MQQLSGYVILYLRTKVCLGKGPFSGLCLQRLPKACISETPSIYPRSVLRTLINVMNSERTAALLTPLPDPARNHITLRLKILRQMEFRSDVQKEEEMPCGPLTANQL